jgi:hypothetical protein
MVMMEQPETKMVRETSRTTFLSAIPLLAFVVIAYVAFAWAGADFTLPRFTPTLPSGGAWQITLGDMLLTFALIVLFFEVVKSTGTGGNSVVDHALSTIVFLVWQPAATSLFFLITVISLIDVIAGFSVTIRSARRDYSVG